MAYELRGGRGPLYLEVGQRVDYTRYHYYDSLELLIRLCLAHTPETIGVINEKWFGTYPDRQCEISTEIFSFDLMKLTYQTRGEALMAVVRGAELVTAMLAHHPVVFKNHMRFASTGWSFTRLK